jgi:hypothetical protein
MQSDVNPSPLDFAVTQGICRKSAMSTSDPKVLVGEIALKRCRVLFWLLAPKALQIANKI